VFLLSYNNYQDLHQRKYKQAQFIEPQVKVVYNLLPLSSLYVSHSSTYQPIHYIPLANITIPMDIQLSTNSNIRPMRMNQIVGGVKYSKNNKLEFSLDTYYRVFTNTYEFNGNIIELNKTEDIDDFLYRGRGASY